MMVEVMRRPESAVASILVVDDDEDLRAMVKLVLERRGFLVHEANCIAAALSAPQVDLLITDLHLPDGTGEELINRLRALHPQAAIALSGSRASQPTPFDAHLLKPTAPHDLLASVDRVLASGA